MKFMFFHLMPWTDPVDEALLRWPVANEAFDPARAAQLYRLYLDEMCLAEECGFDWLGFNEHHMTQYGLMANPNIIAGALCQRTSRARIAVVGNLIPMLNPVRVAEEYAMIDLLSEGRLVAGFLRGAPNEYLSYYTPPDESQSRFAEAFDLIVRAWTERRPFAWEGEHYRFRGVSIWPRPYQQPHPPILMSGSSPRSAALAAKKRVIMGMVQIGRTLDNARRCVETYRSVARADGWEPTPDHLECGFHTCIADTDEQARRLLSDGEHYFYRNLLGPSDHATRLVVQETGYEGRQAGEANQLVRAPEFGRMQVEEWIEHGSVVCGSPRTVIEQIRYIHKVLGIGVLNLNFRIGTIPHEAVLKGLELFKRHVLPEVRGL